MSSGKFHRGTLAAAKLTPQKVYEMRQRYNQGWTQGRLSREYQVTIGTVGRIVRGESWQQYRQEEHPVETEHYETLGEIAVAGTEPELTPEMLESIARLEAELANMPVERVDVEALMARRERGEGLEIDRRDDLIDKTQETSK